MNLIKSLFIVCFCLFILPNKALSQYAPQAGIKGTTAIHKDSSLISRFMNYRWVNDSNFIFERGWRNLADTVLGKVTVGTIDSFLNAEPGTYILSLGDKGSITLALNQPMLNGFGPDFVVFENGFPFGKDSFFLELAFVEVSSDGKKFYRFPAVSKTDTSNQIGPFGSLKAHEIHNLAGKYVAPYGVPFDLEDLKDSLTSPIVTHIRLVDVGGSIQDEFCSRDVLGNKINDPFPTPFPSSGFDLLMIGFVNILAGFDEYSINKAPQIAPNPTLLNESFSIDLPYNCYKIVITDASGKVCFESNEKFEQGIHWFRPNLNPGWYFVQTLMEDEKLGLAKLIVLPQ